MSVTNQFGDVNIQTDIGIDPLAAAVFGEGAAIAETTGYAIWGAAAGVILSAIGAYKQYQMYEKMGDLAEIQAKAIADQQSRTNRLTDEYFIPQLKKARDYLWGYANTWGRNVQELVVECATSVCTYTPPVRDNVAVVAQIAKVVNAAKRAARRSLGSRQVGVACDQAYRMGAMQATLLMGANEVVTRFEDEKTLKWNQFYWTKMLAAAQLAQNTLTVGSNMVVGAASGVNSVLSSQNQLFSIAQQNLQLEFTALGGQASVFGGLGNLGGLITGTILGGAEGARLLQRPTSGRPTDSDTQFNNSQKGRVLEAIKQDRAADDPWVVQGFGT